MAKIVTHHVSPYHAIQGHEEDVRKFGGKAEMPLGVNKFRKKPVVIEAMQFDGTKDGANAVLAWIGGHGGDAKRRHSTKPDQGIIIATLEGDHLGSTGDWIIKGVQGEFYPCKPEIFTATYEDATLPAARAEVSVAEAVRDVLAERERQISTEGWTPEHDDQHDEGEIAAAAAAYAFNAATSGRYYALDPIGFWPWDAQWWKPSDPRRDLVKAGALILSEIERIDRALLRALTEASV